MIFQVDVVVAFETTGKFAFAGGFAAVALFVHARVELFSPIIRQFDILFVGFFDRKFDWETVGVIEHE